MSSNTRSAATTFRALHTPGAAFLMPNAWDAGSAVILAEAGFDAIATTSGGIAFALARADFFVPEGATPVSREQMFDRMREIVDAVDVPVSGDLQDGFGRRPEDVAETIRMAIEIGLAGALIEDWTGSGLYDEELAVERIAAARAVIDAARSDFVLTGRTDAFQTRAPDALELAIRRLERYREAGSDVLYAPGTNDIDQIAALVREVDGPINAVMGLGDTALTVAALRSAGVTRISLGATLARASLGFLRQSARELIERGTLDFAQVQIPGSELGQTFATAERRHRLAGAAQP